MTGYDGGLPQLVVLEALDSASGTVRFNVTANETGKFFSSRLNNTSNSYLFYRMLRHRTAAIGSKIREDNTLAIFWLSITRFGIMDTYCKFS